ncbi:MAG: hypothetical protein AAF211_04915 [Myxococcota bacterium]
MRLVWLVLALAGLVLPARSSACSCDVECRPQPVLTSDVPANVTAIRILGCGDQEPVPVLQRKRASGWTSVGVRLLREEGSNEAWLVHPDRRWRTGEVYRFGVATTRFAPIEFRVVPRLPRTIFVDARVSGPVMRWSDFRRSSCSSSHNGARYEVELSLPEEWEAYRGLFVVMQRVDGRAWRHTRSVCDGGQQPRPLASSAFDLPFACGYPNPLTSALTDRVEVSYEVRGPVGTHVVVDGPFTLANLCRVPVVPQHGGPLL